MMAVAWSEYLRVVEAMASRVVDAAVVGRFRWQVVGGAGQRNNE